MKEYRDENGKLHRKDGPAVERADGTKEWWIHGELHREDGPAYEGTSGTKCWYFYGKRHREDGPAKEWADGFKEWWWEGLWIMKTEGPVTESQIKEFKLRTIK